MALSYCRAAVKRKRSRGSVCTPDWTPFPGGGGVDSALGCGAGRELEPMQAPGAHRGLPRTHAPVWPGGSPGSCPQWFCPGRPLFHLLGTPQVTKPVAAKRGQPRKGNLDVMCHGNDSLVNIFWIFRRD